MTQGRRTFLLDGTEIPFRPGDTILTAARRAGHYIPALCWHRRTGILSNCRVCIVRVTGREGYVLSCAESAVRGMEVRSRSRDVRASRRSILSLLLERGNHDCRDCPADGDCELQEAAHFVGLKPLPGPNGQDPDGSAPFIERRHDKCILCGRCIAACTGTVVHDVLSFAGRGSSTRVICDDDLPMGGSSCVQCGECAQVCPTGAIVDRHLPPSCRHGREIETVCPYCGVGCGISLTVSENRITGVRGTEGHVVNDGMLCVKGRYGLSFATSSERLTRPLARTARGTLEETTWNEALNLLAGKLLQVRASCGADAIAGLSSAKCTNEENYLFQKLMRSVLGTNNVDHCARLCHSSTVTGMSAALGSGAMTNSLADLPQADVFFVIGSDTEAAHPVIASLMKRSVRSGSSRLMVADPKGTALERHAFLSLRHHPGSDVALINAIMHVIVQEGLHDRSFIASRTSRFKAFSTSLRRWTPRRAASLTGVPSRLIEEAAVSYGSAARGAVLYAMGITQHTSGTDNVRSLVNLQLLTGNFGRAGTGLNPLRGQCNVQGACDMGALPDLLPGYRKVNDPAARRHFGDAWRSPIPTGRGLKALEMIDAAGEGTLKALYIVGENPCLSDPDAGHVRSSLAALDFLVVQDLFLTETAQLADLVLPAASFAEKDGHFTNTERRVQRLRRALEPPGEALEDGDIITRLAARLGGDWPPFDPRNVHAEIQNLVPSYSGISRARTARRGVQWPAPAGRGGTPILHVDAFPSGKAPFAVVDWSAPDEPPDRTYPFRLTTGRLLAQFHTGTMTRRTPGLDSIAKPMVAVSPEDASRLGLSAGDSVRVSTRRGSVTVPAAISPGLPVGLLFMPFHFHESPANELTNPARDAEAGIPELKICAARLSRAPRKKQA